MWLEIGLVKRNISSESDTDQGEAVTEKLKFAAKQLNDRIQLHTSGASYEFSELPNTPYHGQALVNESDELPATPQAITSFLQGSKRKCPTPWNIILRRK